MPDPAPIIDIDHSSRHLLGDGSAGCYGVEGTRRLARHLGLPGHEVIAPRGRRGQRVATR